MSRKDPMQMADIARIAGVSKSTVSRALADSSLVNEKTKSLIRDIAQQHGYRVNIAARNFRLKESLTVALLIPQADGVDWTISDAFFLEMTAAIAEALDERGHALLLTRATPQSGEWIEEFVRRRQADGIILIGQGSQHELIQQISETFQGISVWGEAIALMTALQQNGVDVPGQCAVVGYDDLPIARWYHPALTTVHQSRTLGAQILVDNLLAAIEGRDTSNVKLDPQLVVRESA